MTSRWPDLAVLELFVAVADHGSLGAGARAVGMAQPNASRAAAALERGFGLALLDRNPRGSRLTANGVLLVGWAREVLASADRLTAGAETLREGAPETLLVAASMTVAEYLMPAWLAELHQQEARLRVNLRVCNSSQAIGAVQAGDLQLAFVETPHVPSGVHRMVVAEDELTVVVAPGHSWARRREPLTLAELAAAALVVRETGSGTREALDDILRGRNPAEPAQVLASNAAVRISVAAGAGPAVLSGLAVAPWLDSGELCRVPVEGIGAPRPLTAIWSGPRRLHGGAAQLVAIAAAPRPSGSQRPAPSQRR